MCTALSLLQILLSALFFFLWKRYIAWNKLRRISQTVSRWLTSWATISFSNLARHHITFRLTLTLCTTRFNVDIVCCHLSWISDLARSLLQVRESCNTAVRDCLLSSFAKLWKATVSFYMSVSPSVRMEKLGSNWTNFHENWYLSIFRKSVEKIQTSLKSEKSDDYFTWRSMKIYGNISVFLQEWKMFHTKVGEEIKTHFMFNFFFQKNRAVYEIV